MSEDIAKTCANCRNSYTVPPRARYTRCKRAEAPQTADGSLCGEMRKGACGPDASLWEAKDG